MKKFLLNYTLYNCWANKRITGFLDKLDPDLWDKELNSSFRTIRKTVYHIWDAQVIWLTRLSGESFMFFPSEFFNGSNDEFIKAFNEQSEKFPIFVRTQTEDELNEICNYLSTEGKQYRTSVSDVLLHSMNHSTFHRGQIVTMLRTAGFTKLDSTDYITYTRELKK